MAQPAYKSNVTEGELDEEEEEEVVEAKPKNDPQSVSQNTSTPTETPDTGNTVQQQQSTKIEKVEPAEEKISYDKINSVADLTKTLTDFEKTKLNNLKSKCAEITDEHEKMLKDLEKRKLDLYSQEIIEIQDTFNEVPNYLKKIRAIKAKMNDIEALKQKIKAKLEGK